MLTGVLAHEINNCLVPITLYAQLLIENSQTSPALQPDLQAVLNAARRAKQVVEQVLDFSRGSAAAPARAQDLRAPAEEALRLIRVLVPSNVELRTELLQPARSAAIEPGQLIQLIVNLCTNALQAMRAKGGVLTVGFVPQSSEQADPALPPGRYLQLRVTDTGHGMDAVTLAHVFEPYFSAGEGEGTGLGLAVSQSIVQRIGGSIRIHSAPGQGTEVIVSIPAQP